VSVREIVTIGDPALREPTRELSRPYLDRNGKERDEFVRRVTQLVDEVGW
jgi:hypothetical protein